jgi:lipopolysaccharide/colanic/teichoic acid biosynthesis glycosyltransferase
VKRAFDIVVAGLALVALSPVMAIVALIVKLESPGPVVYTQPRIGKGGAVFTMYKFRTMRTDTGGAEAAVPVPQVSDFSTYVFDPLHGGKRYTRIGRFLRSASLDELPNLVNVLKGDMSIIGPRPEVPELVEQYLPEFHRRHDVRPGITGLAQTLGRGDLTYEETMQYDLEYVDDHSLLRDLKILAQTIPVVLSRKGAR